MRSVFHDMAVGYQEESKSDHDKFYIVRRALNTSFCSPVLVGQLTQEGHNMHSRCPRI